ncbi:MAG: alpha/beta hydrolase [Rhizobacter sp.]
MTHPTPLLLLPGLMNDERVWQPIVDALPAGRQVVLGKTHLHDNVAASAAEAIASMPPGPFAVAGFSLGGYVTIEVCRQATDRIAGIALLDTGARADADESKANRQKMIASLADGKADLAQATSNLVPRLLHPAHVNDTQVTELLTDMARNVGTEGFVRQQTAAMNRPDNRPVLPTLKVPALVLCGREDQVTPPALSEEMAGLLAGDVDLVVVPESGHMTTLEQPAAVVAAFTRWVGRVDAAG